MTTLPALRPIGAVAAELGLAAHVLRFWETRLPGLAPIKRAGGRRYYRPADVALLRAIARLSRERGMTLDGIARLLREDGAAAVAARYGADGGYPPMADAAGAIHVIPDLVQAAARLRTALATYRAA